MKPTHRLLALLFPFALAACSITPPSGPSRTFHLPEAGRVQVSWLDPESYRESSCRSSPQGRDVGWARALAEYTRTQAERRLPAGETLTVLFKDIDRAGECEPSRLGSEMIRVVRDIYPPRIELGYTLTGSTRTLPAQGAAQLTDPAFLMGGTGMLDSDPLRYEKRVIDDWLRRLSSKP